MSFAASIGSCFKKYAVFNGRASRSEFWWFFLAVNLIVFPLLFLGPAALLILGLALPTWAVLVRRLHDLDKSGWNALFFLIPIIQLILLLVWCIRKGTQGDNRFGVDPFASEGPKNAPANSFALMTTKTEQLAKLKALLDDGTVTQAEFDKMKAEVMVG